MGVMIAAGAAAMRRPPVTGRTERTERRRAATVSGRGEAVVIEVVDRQERKLTLRTRNGSALELAYNEGPDGQVELSVNSGGGQHAVWVASDLVLGGEEDDGYPAAEDTD